MRLLVFAHRGEAQVFLKKFDLSWIDTPFGGVYLNDKYILALCGEGIQAASEVTASCMTLYPEINEIWNLGICAGAHANSKKLDSFSIRTVYSHNQDFNFKSFTSSDSQASHDCVSVYKRITHKTEKEKFSIIAPLLDRELWAIASVAKRFKTPWKSIKVVSDILDEDTQCQDIYEDAFDFSLKLFDEFNKKTQIKNNLKAEKKYVQDLETMGFYLTFSQVKRMQKIIETYLNLFHITWEEFKSTQDFKDILSQEINAKKKTKQLISFIERNNDPFAWRAKLKIESLFKDPNLQISYDQNLESQEVKVQGIIKKIEDIEKIKESIDNLPYKNFLLALNGESDV